MNRAFFVLGGVRGSGSADGMAQRGGIISIKMLEQKRAQCISEDKRSSVNCVRESTCACTCVHRLSPVLLVCRLMEVEEGLDKSQWMRLEHNQILKGLKSHRKEFKLRCDTCSALFDV